MKKIASLGLVLAALVPSLAFAATNLFNIMTILVKIMNYVIPILITLGVIYFIWSVIQYTLSTDEEAKSGARKGIVAGLIGLFVIISFWGIVRLAQNTLGINNYGEQATPFDVSPIIQSNEIR